MVTHEPDVSRHAKIVRLKDGYLQSDEINNERITVADKVAA